MECLFNVRTDTIFLGEFPPSDAGGRNLVRRESLEASLHLHREDLQLPEEFRQFRLCHWGRRITHHGAGVSDARIDALKGPVWHRQKDTSGTPQSAPSGGPVGSRREASAMRKPF